MHVYTLFIMVYFRSSVKRISAFPVQPAGLDIGPDARRDRGPDLPVRLDEMPNFGRRNIHQRVVDKADIRLRKKYLKELERRRHK